MKHIIVGLGNPGKEYEDTRHNAGRTSVLLLGKKHDIEIKEHKKGRALVGEGKIEKENTLLVLPETFMNVSGKSVSFFVKSPKMAKTLVLVHDDMDLPIGVMRIVWHRGSGGHKGVESVMRAIKTKEFARIRIGVSPGTPKGRAKKPNTEKKILSFIVGPFTPKEKDAMKKVYKRAGEAIETILSEGLPIAMNRFN